MAELIEEHWVARCNERTANERLDALRRRANFLEGRIARDGGQQDLRHDKHEHAAIRWAIAELSGIGDELRRRRDERDELVGKKYRKAAKQVEHLESVVAQLRVSNAALKQANHMLRMAMNANDRAEGASTEGRNSQLPDGSPR